MQQRNVHAGRRYAERAEIEFPKSRFARLVSRSIKTAEEINMARYIGADKNGIPRVYGEAKQADVAYTECAQAVRGYVQRRPDTGPASSWIIEKEAA